MYTNFAVFIHLVYYRFKFSIYAYLYSVQKRIFRDAILQTVGNLTSASETETNIIDRWRHIYALHVEYFIMCPSNQIVIIKRDICTNPLTRRVTSNWFTDKTIEGTLALDKTKDKVS